MARAAAGGAPSAPGALAPADAIADLTHRLAETSAALHAATDRAFAADALLARAAAITRVLGGAGAGAGSLAEAAGGGSASRAADAGHDAHAEDEMGAGAGAGAAKRRRTRGARDAARSSVVFAAPAEAAAEAGAGAGGRRATRGAARSRAPAPQPIAAFDT
jgi:hypothetical protein